MRAISLSCPDDLGQQLEDGRAALGDRHEAGCARDVGGGAGVLQSQQREERRGVLDVGVVDLLGDAGNQVGGAPAVEDAVDGLQVLKARSPSGPVSPRTFIITRSRSPTRLAPRSSSTMRSKVVMTFSCVPATSSTRPTLKRMLDQTLRASPSLVDSTI